MAKAKKAEAAGADGMLLIDCYSLVVSFLYKNFCYVVTVICTFCKLYFTGLFNCEFAQLCCMKGYRVE